MGRREKGVRCVEVVEVVGCASAAGWKMFSCADEGASSLLGCLLSSLEFDMKTLAARGGWRPWMFALRGERGDGMAGRKACGDDDGGNVRVAI